MAKMDSVQEHPKFEKTNAELIECMRQSYEEDIESPDSAELSAEVEDSFVTSESNRSKPVWKKLENLEKRSNRNKHSKRIPIEMLKFKWFYCL